MRMWSVDVVWLVVGFGWVHIGVGWRIVVGRTMTKQVGVDPSNIAAQTEIVELLPT